MLLTTLERTKQVSQGNLQWINDMIRVRETLIVDYFKILSIPEELDAKSLTREEAGKQLNEFCQALVDYLTRGHFVIYPKILTIMEHVSNRRLTIARRLVPRIEDNTEHLLQFNDMYSEGLNDKNVPLIRKALTRIGELMEVRFKHEDRMVIALQIMDNTMSEAAAPPALREKRHFSRVAYKSPGVFTLKNGRQYEITVKDISIKSALIEFHDPGIVKKGDEGTLDISISPEITITFEVRIARVEGTSVGVICTSIDIDSMTELRRIVEYNCNGNEDLLKRDLEHLIS
ncbi:Rsd/AlgQ family anti-sigma factor [Succinimonas amylolytica]|uniref:Rsd/AlgQ family anti-sigma factor n=1 Tax=Succinimonas amylolytica TaxID=83769 RepID=UPI00036674C3|nr:Rsd/AlgQ family anti-sigma factor [Succinimonas amylolytica]